MGQYIQGQISDIVLLDIKDGVINLFRVICVFFQSGHLVMPEIMMGLPGGGYFEQDASLIWYIAAKGQLDYYKKINEWYRKGYISADNFAYQTEDDKQNLAVSGKAFSVFGYDNHADNYNTDVKADKENFKSLKPRMDTSRIIPWKCGKFAAFFSPSDLISDQIAHSSA